MSKKIVINTFGSLGDLFPYLAIALELKKRGHKPIIAANRTHQSFVEAQHIPFTHVQPEPLDFTSEQELVQKIFSSKGLRYLVCEILMTRLKEAYSDLEKVVVQADLLISHPFTFAAPLIAQKQEIPWISTILSPISLLSAHDPPLFNPKLNLKSFPVWLNRLIIAFLKSQSRSWSKPLQAFRQELGLSSVKDPFFWGQRSPKLNLSLFSPIFAPPQPDWGAFNHLTGFVFYEPHDADLSEQLVKFLAQGSPPIIFTLGSSAVYHARNFYRYAAKATQQLGERAILLVGKNPENIPHDLLSQDIIAVDYAPHFLLFPYAKAIVHQGGIGTTAQAIKAGKPMLVVPFGQDQYDNANRVEQLHLGKMLTLINDESIHLGLNELLQYPAFQNQAQHIKEIITQENGVKDACDQIEQFLTFSA
ncbi:glycosyltransferase [Aphanothece hegewaldii CCALA 016]|uniref:Glycosyltransferase n=1 Tax=Aphanothece hegewaldii CCALA 016 TaxID=2107694 RepID=A0A2T1LS46_9CHRO|nr:glycosyltransferase [Aphanothece hegewaldii]PSF31755.1 glycosyltransferase [Aphanothece hegewaldii CCALA 016]